jgi:hypothetical protein
VDTSNTPVDSRFDPMTGIDVSASTDDHAYDMVPGGDNVVSSPAAPAAAEASEAEPARHRLRTQATGLRGAYSRTDAHLLERAQAGTDLLPGTDS